MDSLTFQKLLMDTTIARCRILTIVLLVSAVLLIIAIIYKMKTKSNKGLLLIDILLRNTHAVARFTLNQQIGMQIVCIVTVVFVICIKAIPAYNDINNQQYRSIEIQSIQSVSDGNKLLSFGRICVIDNDGNELFFNLPRTHDHFPEGRSGTIWYAEDSKVILTFIPANDK